MAENASINVRIDGHEFNAEGPAELIQAQYDQFLKAIAKPSGVLQWSLPESVVETAFSKGGGLVHRRPMVWLNDQLKGPGDYLLLVLYGALVFKSEHDVPATELIAVLRTRYGSGDEDRLDRVFNAHSGLVVKSGAKRGSRYGLSQFGVDRAEKIIEKALSRKE